MKWELSDVCTRACVWSFLLIHIHNHLKNVSKDEGDGKGVLLGS